MPAPPSGDFELNNQPYMLARDPRNRGRAWVRSGLADILGTQRRIVRSIYGGEEQYGGFPDEIDHPAVMDDWSGGFGDFYYRLDQPNHYHFAQNFDARFPKQLIHAQQPNVLPARYASANLNADAFVDVPLPLGSGSSPQPAGAGAVLALGKGFAAHFTPTQYYSTPGSAYDFAIEATGIAFGHKAAVFGSFAYLPNLAGSGFHQRGHDGTTYTLSDSMPARWFQTAAGRLWRGRAGAGSAASGGANGFLAQSLAIGADPLVTANWSATLNVGNGNMTSDAAIAFETRIFMGFPDGLYMGDQTGTFNNVATELGQAVTADSVRDLTAYDDGVVLPAASHVFHYKPSSGANSEMIEVGPSALTSNRSQVRGRFTCVKGYGKWLYAGLFTGSQSYVMVGRNGSGNLPYVWQPMQLLPTTCKISRIHVDSVSATSGGTFIPPRLWVATDATFGAQTGCTAPLYSWPIPYGDDNPVADLTFSATYCGSARLDMAQTDWGLPNIPKVFRALEVTADNLLSGSQYVDVYYTVDNGPRTKLGTATLSPRSVLYFPGLNNPAQAAFIRGNAMAISLESFTASLNVTPVIRSVVTHGFARPPLATEIVAKVRIADNIPDRQGGTLRDGATMLQELRTYAITDQPQRLLDLTGAMSWVAVIPPVQEEEVYQGDDLYPEVVATVKMAVMDFTTNFVSTAGLCSNLDLYTCTQLDAYLAAQLSFL